MSRRTPMDRIKKKVDTKKTKINAAESDRVSSMMLDEVEAEMIRLENVVFFYNRKWACLKEFISRKRKKHSKKKK